MFTLLVLLSQLPTVTLGFPHCARGPKASKHAGEEVFTSKEEANFFIHRRLLYNRFDLELFTPGNLERECNEELCNYEEAREIFVDEDKTIAFWQEYSAKGPTTKSALQPSMKGGGTLPPSFSEDLRRLPCLHCRLLWRMQDYLLMNRQWR
ncbi:transmembrane gamma-carboxyglutamic acid protein 4 isoform X1 [Homo sapiens]|uniref:Proline rich Gla 4 (Transmembrane) isoform 3 n=1 Tax=Homo sapiens TaxID=9606 RepID=A0A0S2Z5M6_HUMAN|nr:transmembrane gamma-carboxyglutamic acid protein 4 isoform X1 [Homo sapiens]ALQ34226.1 proline rich Gla 4 (transmembrane) isoform 3 [Homo sapiens]